MAFWHYCCYATVSDMAGHQTLDSIIYETSGEALSLLFILSLCNCDQENAQSSPIGFVPPLTVFEKNYYKSQYFTIEFEPPPT